MYKIDCVLYIDEENASQLENEGNIRDIVHINFLEKSADIETAMEFLEKGCVIEDRKCPEFIFIDLGSKSIHDENFYNALQKINDAIMIKIQVVFLLDSDNIGELEEMMGLGIEYIVKPLDKSKLQTLFDRYFLLKNPMI